MEEIGFARADFPATARWLARFEALPGFLPLYADGAVSVMRFEEFFPR